jgi:hypothetical protein
LGVTELLFYGINLCEAGAGVLLREFKGLGEDFYAYLEDLFVLGAYLEDFWLLVGVIS